MILTVTFELVFGTWSFGRGENTLVLAVVGLRVWTQP